jgi:hypothetical protein
MIAGRRFQALENACLPKQDESFTCGVFRIETDDVA